MLCWGITSPAIVVVRRMARCPRPYSVRPSCRGKRLPSTVWDGYGSNITQLAQAVPVAGFFNTMTDDDGVVRALPLLAEYQGNTTNPWPWPYSA